MRHIVIPSIGGAAADCLPGRTARVLVLCASLALATFATLAADADPPSAQTDKAWSPWLLLPTISSDPKLGTSVGALGAYMHYFDEQSRVSMFGATAQYTSTGSTVGGAFARTSFGADRHRVLAGAFGGTIKNDYEDFLGTGVPLKTEDQLRAAFGRYLYRLQDDWFIGAQALLTNYHVVGETAFDEQVLNTLGLTGFRSGGIGVVAYHDSRDNEHSPSRGWLLNLNNVAYRDWIAGDNNFDVYRLDLRGYWSHGKRHVFAVRQQNQWTVDAPPSAYAPVTLRGYKMGQYLGKNMSSIEAEERLRIADRWTVTLFAGVACLYGNDNACSESANLYPNGGAGLQFILKEKEGIVANLEYAQGKAGNYGVYLKMGYGY